MSRILINKYYSDVDKVFQFGKTKNEGSISIAFYNLLNVQTNCFLAFLIFEVRKKQVQMSDKLNNIIREAQAHMDKAIHHLEAELGKIRAGKANPQMLESVHVDYYGSNMPLYQVSNINTPDARSIVVQPYEKSMLQPIEKAIIAANLGFNPQNDGNIIRINVPPLTEERRKDLVKKTKHEGENAKIGVRAARRDANEHIKKLVKDGVPEDLIKDAETRVQHLTDNYISKVDKHLELKEAEIMHV